MPYPSHKKGFGALLAPISVAVLLALAVGVIFLGGVAGPSKAAVSPNASTQSPKVVVVTMKGDINGQTYHPATVVVVIGVNNTVEWINDDSASHTVTATSVPSGAQMFDSGNLAPGQTFNYTFTVPGNYTYHCRYHPWMVGTVVVLAAGAASTTTSTTTLSTTRVSSSTTSTAPPVMTITSTTVSTTSKATTSTTTSATTPTTQSTSAATSSATSSMSPTPTSSSPAPMGINTLVAAAVVVVVVAIVAGVLVARRR